MIKNEIQAEYYEWMYGRMCYGRCSDNISYHKLFEFLHGVEFSYMIHGDKNRAEDGRDLREYFAHIHDIEDISDLINGPCSILEMMIALAIRIEDSIMDNPEIGDRAPQWFWKMIVTLGLGGMRDDLFNQKKAEKIINRFLNREYESDGKGGLFRVRDCEHDMRNVEIWVQMLWYLDTIS